MPRKLDQLFRMMLVLHIWSIMGLVRLALLMVPFRYLAPYLSRSLSNKGVDRRQNDEVIAKVLRAIRTASCFTPWQSKCLVQAITGKILLRQYNIPNILYLGVAKDENKNLRAHAWLCLENSSISKESHACVFRVIAEFHDTVLDRKK